MNAEKRLSWAQSELIKAMSESLRGSVTFHFNDGFLVSSQKISNLKPDIDDCEKKA